MWAHPHVGNLCAWGKAEVKSLAQCYSRTWSHSFRKYLLPCFPKHLSSWQWYEKPICPQHSNCPDLEDLQNALSHLTLLFVLQGQCKIPLHWPSCGIPHHPALLPHEALFLTLSVAVCVFACPEHCGLFVVWTYVRSTLASLSSNSGMTPSRNLLYPKATPTNSLSFETWLLFTEEGKIKGDTCGQIGGNHWASWNPSFSIEETRGPDGKYLAQDHKRRWWHTKKCDPEIWFIVPTPLPCLRVGRVERRRKVDTNKGRWLFLGTLALQLAGGPGAKSHSGFKPIFKSSTSVN